MLPPDVRAETVAFHLLKHERSAARLERLRKEAADQKMTLSLTDQYMVFNG